MLSRTAAVGAAFLAGCLDGGPAGDGDDGDDGGDGGPYDSPSGTPESTLVDSEFEVTSVMSGTATQAADVSFEDGTVAVEGTTTGNDGCYTAELRDASYEDGRLTVTVEAVDDSEEDQACTQALVEIDYEATFQFEGGLPGSVAVRHDSMGEIHDVADVER